MKNYRVTATGLAYEYEVAANSKAEAIEKANKISKGEIKKIESAGGDVDVWASHSSYQRDDIASQIKTQNLKRKKGWQHESARHALARKGIETGQKKSGIVVMPSYTKATLKATDQSTGEQSDIEMFLPESSAAEKIPDKEREAIINKYKNKENWKYPTQAAVVETEKEAQKIADVLTYYLGGAEIIPSPSGRFIVTSKGYYYYIGA